MECPEAVDAISAGDVVSVDADAGTIVDETTGQHLPGPAVPPVHQGDHRGRRPDQPHAPEARQGVAMTQTYRICLLPGDGIGPEIIAEGVKVLDAVGAKHGAAFAYDRGAHRRLRHRRDGSGAAGRDARRGEGVRRRAAGGRGRPEVGHHRPRKAAPRAGVARHSQGARPVHEPATRADILRARGRLHVEARDRGRRGPDDRPRVDGRFVLRPVASASTTRKAAARTAPRASAPTTRSSTASTRWSASPAKPSKRRTSAATR